MSIQCYLFRDDGAASGCRALVAASMQLPQEAENQLELSLCRSGQFIRCPIFRRCQDWLARTRSIGRRWQVAERQSIEVVR